MCDEQSHHARPVQFGVARLRVCDKQHVMGIISILTGTNGRPRLRDLSLEGDGFTFDRRRENTSIWRTDEGDLVGVYLFHRQPSLPQSECPTDEFKTQWREAAELKGVGVLELGFCHVAAVPAIRSIVRVVSQDSKTTDIGALTLPFKDFFYAVKIECCDCPVTTIGEVIFLDQTPDSDVVQPLGDIAPRNHSVWRIRRWLPRIESALKMTDRVLAMPRYELPGPTSLRSARSPGL